MGTAIIVTHTIKPGPSGSIRKVVTVKHSPLRPVDAFEEEKANLVGCYPELTFFLEVKCPRLSRSSLLASVFKEFASLSTVRVDDPRLWERHIERNWEIGHPSFHHYEETSCTEHYEETPCTEHPTALEIVRHLCKKQEGHWPIVYSVRHLSSGELGSGISENELASYVAKNSHIDSNCVTLREVEVPSLGWLNGCGVKLADISTPIRFLKRFNRDGPGIYIVFEGTTPLYVGMSTMLSRRVGNVAQHHKLKHVMKRHPEAMVHIHFYDHAYGPELQGLRNLENRLIEFYKPLHNSVRVFAA
jgi:hypothetical protein